MTKANKAKSRQIKKLRKQLGKTENNEPPAKDVQKFNIGASDSDRSNKKNNKRRNNIINYNSNSNGKTKHLCPKCHRWGSHSVSECWGPSRNKDKVNFAKGPDTNQDSDGKINNGDVNDNDNFMGMRMFITWEVVGRLFLSGP